MAAALGAPRASRATSPCRWRPCSSCSLILRGSYRVVERVFLVASTFYVAYVISAFMAKPDWGEIVQAAVVPHIELSTAYIVLDGRPHRDDHRSLDAVLHPGVHRGEEHQDGGAALRADRRDRRVDHGRRGGRVHHHHDVRPPSTRRASASTAPPKRPRPSSLWPASTRRRSSRWACWPRGCSRRASCRCPPPTTSARAWAGRPA